MNTIVNKKMRRIEKTWWTAAPLAAAIAFAGASPSIAEANELWFGMVSIAPGQSVRINAVV